LRFAPAMQPGLVAAARRDVDATRQRVQRELDDLVALVADRHAACSTRVPWLVSIGGQMYRWAPTMPNRSNPFTGRRRGMKPKPVQNDQRTGRERGAVVKADGSILDSLDGQ
jgi:hypothetical protein